MADTKISALTAVATPAYTDEFAVNQSAASKKMTLAQVQRGYVAAVTAAGTAADNTTAIHAARTAAGVNGTVIIPAGTYTVNNLQANVAGQRWILSAGCTLSYNASQNSDLLEVSAADVVIEGANWTSVLDQNSASQTGGSGIYITGADRVTIRNLKVMDVKGRGINVTNSDEVLIEGVFVTGTGTDGIFIEGNSGSNNCTVRKCKITGGPATGDADCISAHGNAASGTIHGFRAIDNYLEPNGTGQFGIEVGAFGGVDPQERVIVSGNVIVCTAASFGGISIDSCEGAVVADNSFDANGFACNIAGIEIVKSEECTVTGNRIVGDTSLYLGVALNKSNRNTVVGNTIDGWASGANLAGISIHNSDSDSEQACDNIVSGNVFIFPGSGTNPAVLVYANRTSCVISRNLITGNAFIGAGVASSVGVRIDQSTGTLDYTTVANNHFYNLPTGITVSASIGANNRFGPNRFITVTTPYDLADTFDASDQLRTIQFIIDGGGSAITTGVKGYVELPFSGVILGVTTLADQSGSIVVDLWKDTYANYPPTDADSITSAAPPTLSSATKAQDSTLTGWTRTFTKGDILGYNVDSATTVQRVTISLTVIETG